MKPTLEDQESWADGWFKYSVWFYIKFHTTPTCARLNV